MYSKNISSDCGFLYGMSEVPNTSPQASSGFKEIKSSFFDSRKSAKFNCEWKWTELLKAMGFFTSVVLLGLLR